MSKDGSTSFHGVTNIIFGINDDSGSILTDVAKGGLSETGLVLVDGDGQGATEANITGLEEAGTVQYANNKGKRVSHGKPQPQVAITMLDMPFEILQKLKGYESDGKGGWTLKSGPKPHVAMLINVEGFDGSHYYEGFANGEIIEPGHNHGTDNNAETDANTVLTYQALTPLKADVFANDSGQQPYKSYAAYDGAEFDQAAMLKEVFGGFDGYFDLITGSTTDPNGSGNAGSGDGSGTETPTE